MTDERFFKLAALYGLTPDKALREFCACVESEARAPYHDALLWALLQIEDDLCLDHQAALAAARNLLES